MEVVYRAFDGTEFREAAACVRYEENARKLKMWFKDGKTSLADKSFVVKLEDENDVRIFIERCDNESTVHDGIEFDEYTADTGLFIWEENRCEYVEINDDVLNALIHCLKDEHLI